jgi:hypothetical protein
MKSKQQPVENPGISPQPCKNAEAVARQNNNHTHPFQQDIAKIYQVQRQDRQDEGLNIFKKF